MQSLLVCVCVCSKLQQQSCLQINFVYFYLCGAHTLGTRSSKHIHKQAENLYSFAICFDFSFVLSHLLSRLDSHARRSQQKLHSANMNYVGVGMEGEKCVLLAQ